MRLNEQGSSCCNCYATGYEYWRRTVIGLIWHWHYHLGLTESSCLVELSLAKPMRNGFEPMKIKLLELDVVNIGQ
jgi:hypothetical protein